MKIQIKDDGLILLITERNMFDMSKEDLNEIEKAIKLIRHLREEMNVKNLMLETK